MIGSERCVTNCCGTDITCNETSRTQNHNFLYFTNLVYLVFAFVLVISSEIQLADTHLMVLFPFTKSILTGVTAIGERPHEGKRSDASS